MVVVTNDVCILYRVVYVNVDCNVLLSCVLQSWTEDDYRNARFTDRQKEVSEGRMVVIG